MVYIIFLTVTISLEEKSSLREMIPLEHKKKLLCGIIPDSGVLAVTNWLF